MQNPWRTWKESRDRSRDKYLLRRWEIIRRKGQTRYAMREAVITSLILGVGIPAGLWLQNDESFVRGGEHVSLIVSSFFVLIMFIAGYGSGRRTYYENEMRYRELMSQVSVDGKSDLPI